MYDVPVSFYQGGEKADGYKRICLLPLANLFLHQFIPLVHQLLFLRMYNSDNSTEHRTWILWALWLGILYVPFSWVLIALS